MDQSINGPELLVVGRLVTSYASRLAPLNTRAVSICSEVQHRQESEGHGGSQSLLSYWGSEVSRLLKTPKKDLSSAVDLCSYKSDFGNMDVPLRRMCTVHP